MKARVEDFLSLDIRCGTIVEAAPLDGARKPALRLTVDFGGEIGLRGSSAQITQLYAPERLIGRQVLAVVNFPPRRVAGFVSKVLVLGLYGPEGVVLIGPERQVPNGCKLG